MFGRSIDDETIQIGTHGPLGRRNLRITAAERHTHMYVVGVTGKGKSKLLEHILFQDIIAGRGCGVLDPHGDLVTDLLRYLANHPRLAEQHWKRIIYLDPTRDDFIIPFNVLKSEFSPYETAQNIVEAFRRTWPVALREAPRFANIATASILTLIANGLALTDMLQLLTNKSFREAQIVNLEDPELISFWRGRFEKWGRERPLMIESLLNKVSSFTINPHLRYLLGSAENKLPFRRLMDDGKVLLIDLGRCDAETRRLVGSLVVTGIEQAARSRRNSTGRRPYYFCIDEFQDFSVNDGASQTLAQILSECRKFGLHLTLAHQTLAQISPRLQGALGNIQLRAIFGVSRPDAEVLARHLFQADGEQIKHMVRDANQQNRSHPIYYSLQEEWERSVQTLQNLPQRYAYISRPGKRMGSKIKTVPIRYESQMAVDINCIRRQLAEQSGISLERIQRQVARKHNNGDERAQDYLSSNVRLRERRTDRDTSKTDDSKS